MPQKKVRLTEVLDRVAGDNPGRLITALKENRPVPEVVDVAIQSDADRRHMSTGDVRKMAVAYLEAKHTGDDDDGQEPAREEAPRPPAPAPEPKREPSSDWPKEEGGAR